MVEINDVEVYVLNSNEKENLGCVIDPPSDVKTVFIPSPPTKREVKTNPRDVVILVSDPAIKEDYAELDALKAHAKEKKLFIACPAELEPEAIAEMYNYMISKATALNVKKNSMTVKFLGDAGEAAQEFVDYAVDELDADLEDAEAFEL